VPIVKAPIAAPVELKSILVPPPDKVEVLLEESIFNNSVPVALVILSKLALFAVGVSVRVF